METGNKVGLGMVGVGVVGGGYQGYRAVKDAKDVEAILATSGPKLDAAVAAQLKDPKVEGAFERAMSGSEDAQKAAAAAATTFAKESGVAEKTVGALGHSLGSLAFGALAAVGGVVLLAKAIF